jgi:predicted N-acetyltransferase YhbS
MITIRLEKPSDATAREALLDLAYGQVRFTKPSERLRAGRKPARGLSFVAVEDGRVDPAHRCHGIGSALMRHALRAAARRGHRVVLLAGDASYYGRFGFSAERTAGLWLPGLADRSRLLARELAAGALDGVRGAIRAPAKQRIPFAAAVPGLVRPEPKAA